MNTTAIANHLNVAESAIVEVQEWARVLWVRVKGLGARFVSKKIGANKMSLTEDLRKYSKPFGEEQTLIEACSAAKRQERPAINKKIYALKEAREGVYKKLLNEAWGQLKDMGWEKFSYRGNAALESGHSDYADEDANYHFHGVQKDGISINAEGLYWHEAILGAAEHEGI